MERLTFNDGNTKGTKHNIEYGDPPYPIVPKFVIERLVEIEDILGDKYDLGRLREFVEADKDGRCGIPPVKLHQTIYRVFDGKILEETVCKVIWEPFVPRPRWKVWVMGSGNPYYWNDCIGKTVFLTREAAESALKGDQDAAEV